MTSRGSGMVRLIVVSLIVMSFAFGVARRAISLQEAVKIALEANPEIGAGDRKSGGDAVRVAPGHWAVFSASRS